MDSPEDFFGRGEVGGEEEVVMVNIILFG